MKRKYLDVKFTIYEQFPPEKLGEWSYTVQGAGVRPTVMKALQVTCPLGDVVQTLLPFRNPLDHPITVTAKLLDTNTIHTNGYLHSSCTIYRYCLLPLVNSG